MRQGVRLDMTMTLRAVVEIVMTGLLVACFAAIVITMIRILRRPAAGTCTPQLFTVIVASGNAHKLEHTVQSLLWLRENGKLGGRVLIADCGLSAESRKVAELLAERSALITLCSQADLPFVLEEKHGLRASGP